MQNIFFNEEVLSAEKKIMSSLNIASLVLMENAGANSAGFIIRKYKEVLSKEVVIISGKGNNAGDGFVIARHLANHGRPVKVLTLFREKELTGDALINYRILVNLKENPLSIVYCKDAKDMSKEIKDGSGIIIDAIFGVGFKGELDNSIRSIVELMNQLKDKTVISIDTPSGLSVYDQKSISVKASVTLTMGVKKFHSLFYKGRESSGKQEIMDTGIPVSEFTNYNTKRIFEIEERDVRKLLPSRKINSNKYSNGKVFILSGSAGLTGASYLCSIAAMRTGSGAVVTGVPESLNEIMEIKMTEVMTLPLKETEQKSLSVKCYDEIRSRLDWADTVLIGPGLSKHEDTMELVRRIVKDNNLDYIIDADAISAFKGNRRLLKNRRIILTPHAGEFANLIEKSTDEVISNFYELAKSFAKENNIILVLKNSPTVVTDGDGFYVNSTGRENLATAGTGDILSGIIAGIYSQTNAALNSAIAGVYIHGMCGDRLYDKYGSNSTIAGDLLKEIPIVKNELSRFEN
ncbi:MAG: NAD(P)H-hydrate dehydratase [Ignavibacteria bacterium]|nr:NAD(P)H-hydrate dehydratase [Ignavibacteria bacterium]